MTSKAIEIAGRPIDWDRLLRGLSRLFERGEIARQDYVAKRALLVRCAEKTRATDSE